jgi:hypothetical protein
LPSDKHPAVINEYGWLWLNRDGSPTRLTTNVYAQLMGTNSPVTAGGRLELYAYLLGAKTEFWRAHRQYAGIIHFVYLTCSYPGVYTADHFQDVTQLKLHPTFADYMGEAFKPLGVYINFFQPTLRAGANHSVRVMMVNDESQLVKGLLAVTLESRAGKRLALAEQRFNLKDGGDLTCDLPLSVPFAAVGECVLKATAKPDDRKAAGHTVSRRRVTVHR